MFQLVGGCFGKPSLTSIIYNSKPNELTNGFVLVSTAFWGIHIWQAISDGIFNGSWHFTTLYYNNDITYYICLATLHPRCALVHGQITAMALGVGRMFVHVIIWRGQLANGGPSWRPANWGKWSKSKLSRFCCHSYSRYGNSCQTHVKLCEKCWKISKIQKFIFSSLRDTTPTIYIC